MLIVKQNPAHIKSRDMTRNDMYDDENQLKLP